MPAALVEVSQLGMDEKQIEDPELEAALTQWNAKRDAAALARQDADKVKAVVVAMAEKLDIGTGAVVRVGRWRIERKIRAGRDVSFHTEAKDHLTFHLEDD
jgi:hypothetical protein